MASWIKSPDCLFYNCDNFCTLFRFYLRNCRNEIIPTAIKFIEHFVISVEVDLDGLIYGPIIDAQI